jgi:hypothetical protein
MAHGQVFEGHPSFEVNGHGFEGHPSFGARTRPNEKRDPRRRHPLAQSHEARGGWIDAMVREVSPPHASPL